MKCRCLRWGFWLVWPGCFLLAGKVFLLAESPRQEAEALPRSAKPLPVGSWQPALPDTSGTLDPDVRHTLLARQALAADPLLGRLNLGVRVHQRVAVLWGPVPSAALKQRAEEVLRQLPDFLEVRNELTIEENTEVRPQFLPDVLPGSNALSERPAEERQRRDSSARSPGLPVMQPASGSEENIRLRPPALWLPAVESRRTEATLPQLIAQLQQCQPQWRGLQITVQAGVVQLRGRVARLEDAYDFARALAQLPGVERVLLDDVQTNSAP